MLSQAAKYTRDYLKPFGYKLVVTLLGNYYVEDSDKIVASKLCTTPDKAWMKALVFHNAR